MTFSSVTSRPFEARGKLLSSLQDNISSLSYTGPDIIDDKQKIQVTLLALGITDLLV